MLKGSKYSPNSFTAFKTVGKDVKEIKPICAERLVSYSLCKQKMSSFRGQARWAKMTSPGGKLKSMVCHTNKKVSKAD